MEPTLYPADQVDFWAYVQAFNQAYVDYFVPIHFNTDALTSLLARDGVDLSASQAALVDGQIVAVGMLGVRDGEGWISGVGVLPAYRGQGIGRRLVSALIDAARARHCRQVVLEVIEQNHRAHALYLSLGFEDLRYLDILERSVQAVQEINVPSITIEPVRANVALSLYHALHTAPNPWQRRLASMQPLLNSMKGWIAYEAEERVAYAVGWTQPGFIRFMDVAVKQGAQPALAKLLAHVHSLWPSADGSLINIASDEIASQVLQDLGYQVNMRQFEMVLSLG